MFTYLLLAVAAGFAAVWLYGMIMRTYTGWKVRLPAAHLMRTAAGVCSPAPWADDQLGM